MDPVGKVPVMCDEDMKMFECCAMMQYVLDRYGNGELRSARTDRTYAHSLQRCWFAATTFARPLGEIVNHRREFKPGPKPYWPTCHATPIASHSRTAVSYVRTASHPRQIPIEPAETPSTSHPRFRPLTLHQIPAGTYCRTQTETRKSGLARTPVRAAEILRAV